MSPGHGHPATLQASHPGNTHRGRHGIRSERMLEPRAQEVAQEVMQAPHVDAVDWVGAQELGRLSALIEAIDGELARVGMSGPGARVRWLLEMRLRASGRLSDWLGAYGMTPRGRAAWARDLAGGGLAAEIAARRRASAAPPGCRQTEAEPEASPAPREIEQQGEGTSP